MKNPLFSCGLVRLALVGLLILCASATLQAQSPRKTTFGFDASFDLNYMDGRDFLGYQGRLRPGFSLHGNAYWKLLPKLDLNLGLGYSYKDCKILGAGIVFSSDIDPLTGVYTTSRVNLQFHFHQIQMPILLRYHFGGDEQGFYAGLGPMIGLGFGFVQDTYIQHGNGTVEDLKNVHLQGNSPALGAQACIGHRFDFKEKLDLGVELYALANVGNETNLPVRGNTLGLRLQTWF